MQAAIREPGCWSYTPGPGWSQEQGQVRVGHWHRPDLSERSPGDQPLSLSADWRRAPLQCESLVYSVAGGYWVAPSSGSTHHCPGSLVEPEFEKLVRF